MSGQKDTISSGGVASELNDGLEAMRMDYDLIEISERGEGQENECLICGAEAGQFCTEQIEGTGLGVEFGRKVHLARLTSNGDNQPQPPETVR